MIANVCGLTASTVTLTVPTPVSPFAAPSSRSRFPSTPIRFHEMSFFPSRVGPYPQQIGSSSVPPVAVTFPHPSPVRTKRPSPSGVSCPRFDQVAQVSVSPFIVTPAWKPSMWNPLTLTYGEPSPIVIAQSVGAMTEPSALRANGIFVGMENWMFSSSPAVAAVAVLSAASAYRAGNRMAASKTSRSGMAIAMAVSKRLNRRYPPPDSFNHGHDLLGGELR